MKHGATLTTVLALALLVTAGAALLAGHRLAIEAALKFIASLRIQHQAEQIRNGQPPDNYVPPSELSELEREHLKHAFRVIQTMQESIAKRFGADNLR